jgi:hypothetical protein
MFKPKYSPVVRNPEKTIQDRVPTLLQPAKSRKLTAAIGIVSQVQGLLTAPFDIYNAYHSRQKERKAYEYLQADWKRYKCNAGDSETSTKEANDTFVASHNTLLTELNEDYELYVDEDQIHLRRKDNLYSQAKKTKFFGKLGHYAKKFLWNPCFQVTNAFWDAVGFGANAYFLASISASIILIGLAVIGGATITAAAAGVILSPILALAIVGITVAATALAFSVFVAMPIIKALYHYIYPKDEITKSERNDLIVRLAEARIIHAEQEAATNKLTGTIKTHTQSSNLNISITPSNTPSKIHASSPFTKKFRLKSIGRILLNGLVGFMNGYMVGTLVGVFAIAIVSCILWLAGATTIAALLFNPATFWIPIAIAGFAAAIGIGYCTHQIISTFIKERQVRKLIDEHPRLGPQNIKRREAALEETKAEIAAMRTTLQPAIEEYNRQIEVHNEKPSVQPKSKIFTNKKGLDIDSIYHLFAPYKVANIKREDPVLRTKRIRMPILGALSVSDASTGAYFIKSIIILLGIGLALATLPLLTIGLPFILGGAMLYSGLAFLRRRINVDYDTYQQKLRHREFILSQEEKYYATQRAELENLHAHIETANKSFAADGVEQQKSTGTEPAPGDWRNYSSSNPGEVGMYSGGGISLGSSPSSPSDVFDEFMPIQSGQPLIPVM